MIKKHLKPDHNWEAVPIKILTDAGKFLVNPAHEHLLNFPLDFILHFIHEKSQVRITSPAIIEVLAVRNQQQ